MLCCADSHAHVTINRPKHSYLSMQPASHRASQPDSAFLPLCCLHGVSMHSPAGQTIVSVLAWKHCGELYRAYAYLTEAQSGSEHSTCTNTRHTQPDRWELAAQSTTQQHTGVWQNNYIKPTPAAMLHRTWCISTQCAGQQGNNTHIAMQRCSDNAVTYASC
jgi:hypothetical protein